MEIKLKRATEPGPVYQDPLYNTLIKKVYSTLNIDGELLVDYFQDFLVCSPTTSPSIKAQDLPEKGWLFVEGEETLYFVKDGLIKAKLYSSRLSDWQLDFPREGRIQDRIDWELCEDCIYDEPN